MGRKPAKVYTSINKAYRDINTVVFSLLVRETARRAKMGVFWMVCGDTNHGDEKIT